MMSMENYLECVYQLIAEKGYARMSDVADALQIKSSSVTKMVQKLDKSGYLVYEKNRGFVLTAKGRQIGKRLVYEKNHGFVLAEKSNKVRKRLVYRHELLEEFLSIIGVDEDNIHGDAKGIEQHLSWDSIDCIGDLVQYFHENENHLKKLQEQHNKRIHLQKQGKYCPHFSRSNSQ